MKFELGQLVWRKRLFSKETDTIRPFQNLSAFDDFYHCFLQEGQICPSKILTPDKHLDIVCDIRKVFDCFVPRACMEVKSV